MADKISEIYGKAVQKGVLAEGMTEDQFREKTSTEKGLRSFYDYASTHGMKFHDYDTFKQRFYGTQEETVNSNENQPQAVEQPASVVDVVTPTRRKISPFAGFQESGVSTIGDSLVTKEQEQRWQKKEDELREQKRSQSIIPEPSSPLDRGPVRDNADFMRRIGITKQNGPAPTVGEMKEQMNNMRAQYAQEVYDRRYLNKDGKPKDSYVKDLFENWQAGVGEVALTPYKAVEAVEDLALDAENAIRGTQFKHGQGMATRFVNNVLGGNYLRSRVEHYRKESDRYQDNKGILESGLEGDFGTAVGKAVLNTIQSAPNLAVSIYTGKKGMETLGGTFLGTTAALQKYDEIKDNESLSAADKALAMFGAFVSECVPEIIGAKRYGKMFNQKTVGTLRKETQKEVLSSWQKFINSSTIKQAGKAWDWIMQYFGEGLTESMTDVMNLGIDLALGVKDEVTKKDLMSIGDSFIVGQLSDAIPSGVHMYQKDKYEHAVKREIEGSPVLSFAVEEMNTTPEKIAEIAAKVVHEESVSDKDAELYNKYQEAIANQVTEMQGIGVLLSEAGLVGKPNTYGIFKQAVNWSGKTEDEVRAILHKGSKISDEEFSFLNSLANKMREIAIGENVQVDETPAQQEEVKAEESTPDLLSTGNKPLEFTLRMKVESRESGKTSDVEKDVKVSFRSGGYRYADDGSIIADKFTILIGGKPATGKKKEAAMAAINKKLRSNKIEADNQAAAEAQAQAEQAAAQVQAEQEAVAEQAAVQAEEQRVQQVYAGLQQQVGEKGLEVIKRFTPEQKFIWTMQEEGVEAALEDARIYLNEASQEKDPTIRRTGMRQWQTLIDKYGPKNESVAPEQTTQGAEQPAQPAQPAEQTPTQEPAQPAVEQKEEPKQDQKPKKESKQQAKPTTEPKPKKKGTPKEEKKEEPQKPIKKARKAPGFEEGMNVFAPDVYLVKDAGGRLSLVKADKKPANAVKNKQKVYLDAEGKTPILLWSSAPVTSTKGNVKYVDADGNIKEVSRNSVFMEEAIGDKMTIVPVPAPKKENVTTFGTILGAKLPVEGETYSFGDFLKTKKVGSTKKDGGEGVKYLNGYQVVAQHINERTDLTDEQKDVALNSIRGQISRWISQWNSFANNVLMNATGLKEKDKMPAYAMNLSKYRELRDKYAVEGNIKELDDLQKKIMQLTFTVSSADETNLTRDSFFNPLYQLAVMVDVAQKAGLLGDEQVEVSLPESLQRIANSTVVTPQDIEKARSIYAKEKEKKHKTGPLEAEFPEVMNNLPALVRFAQPTSEKGKRSQSNKWYDKKLGEVYDKMGAALQRIEEEQKAGEELNDFKRRLAQAYAFVMSGDTATLETINEEIQSILDSHQDNPAFQKAFDAMQKQIDKYVQKQEQNKDALDRANALEKRRQLEIERENWQQEKDGANKRDEARAKKGEGRRERYRIEEAAIKIAAINAQIKALEEANPWLADEFRIEQEVAVLRELDEQLTKQNEIMAAISAKRVENPTNADRQAEREQNERLKQLTEQREQYEDEHPEANERLNQIYAEEKKGGFTTTVKPEFSAVEAAEVPTTTPHTNLVLKTFRKLFGWAGLQVHHVGGQDKVPDALREIYERYGINPEMMILGEKYGAELIGDYLDARGRLDALVVARRMERAGESKREIRLRTGWERGADGMWKYEIEDMVLSRDAINKACDYVIRTGGVYGMPIGMALQKGSHNIFEDYTKANWKGKKPLNAEPYIYFYDDKDTSTLGFADEYGIHINVSGHIDNLSIQKTFIHECQHIIQNIEGFARGGSTKESATLRSRIYDIELEVNEAIKKIDFSVTEFQKLLDDPIWHATFAKLKSNGISFPHALTWISYLESVGEIDADESLRLRNYIANKGGEVKSLISQYNTKGGENLYRDLQDHGDVLDRRYYSILAGEVESRNVEERIELSPEERRNTLLSETQDVRNTDQIIIVGGINRYNELTGVPKRDLRPLYLEYKGKYLDTRYHNGSKVLNDLLKEMTEDLPKETGLGGRGRNSPFAILEIIFSNLGTNLEGGKILELNATNFLEAAKQINFTDKDKALKFLEAAAEWIEDNESLFDVTSLPQLEKIELEFFKKPNGTILGWAIGNEIYLTDEGLNSETPIHEYTHLWVKSLRNENPEAWSKIVALCKKNKHLWDDVANDPAYENIKGDEDAIASEMLARYSGKNGAKKLEEAARKIVEKSGVKSDKLVDSLISNMRNALQEFWRVIKDLFRINNNVTIEEVADLVLKDLFDGKPLNLNTEEMNAIKEQAIKDGTFMKAPNGQDTNLTERQWLSVRTKAFKEWYGDWENPQEGEQFLLDENGEPMVVFHGTAEAGFDLFEPQDNGVSNGRGIFTTPQRYVAGVYAKLVGEEENEFEAHIGKDEHRGIYSLFANIKNPMVVDCTNPETGEPSMWDKIPSGIYKIVGPNMATQYFDNYEDAVEWMYDNGFGLEWQEGNEEVEEPEIIPEYYTTDMLVDMAREQGYDGVVFNNIIDGTDSKLLEDEEDSNMYMHAHQVVVAMTPNQLKSAVSNNGLYSQEDARIEYQYAESDLSALDESAEKRIKREEDKAQSTMINPDLSEQERANWWENVVTMIADKSNGMRLMLNSINAYRKLRGEEPLDGDKYDVRTKFEACRSIIANKVGFLERGIQQELDDTVREFAQVVADSQFYKDHMNEVGGDKPTTLTPVQFIERYLMARNNWERAKEGVPRGLAEFKERMGMGVIEFSNAFTEAYGEKTVLNLWEKIRQMTDFALDTNYEGGMISEELYQELKSKKFYVPQRGFWDDVNPENEENAADDLLQRRQRGNSVARNKLDSMHKAEGGKSLAEGCLAYIARDARQAIKLSEENKVKKVMFDLLRDNEDWCHEPEHNFKVPRQVYYMTNENGEIVRMDDGPTEEQQQEMRQLKSIIRQLKEEYMKAETDEERDAIMEEIYATEEQLPYFDEKDSYRILHTRAKTNKAIVGLYVNGYPCEIEMTPRFISVADALNGRVDRKGEITGLKTVTSWLSAQFTMNNPTFFAVNITRDTPLILTKGAAEYGPEFSARFTVNWAKSQKAIWNYLLTGKVDESEIGAQLLDFLNNGGNTGYSNLEEMDRWRRRVADLNPGGLQEIRQKLSSVEGAKDAAKMIGKGLLKFGDKTISWAELRPMARVLNEWSEIISRFSAYKSVVDMGLGVNEGIKAAHNLSTNFNRRGLGHWFINFFNSLTVFANAGIQGASGYWRTLDSQDGAKGIAKKVAKTAAYMGMLPAFLGFLSTMLNPDDDDYEYAVSEYERDNYVILGNKRLALNEQLKPWWVVGVNIAQLARGKRTLKQSCNSILTSMFTNWVPLPQNLTGSANMLIENMTGKEEWNIAQIARNAIMPSAMQTMNQWADNKNFLGGKLRYDIGDIPEYDMAPNEAALYKDLAKVFYLWGGGNEKVPSKTKENGEKIRRWWDVNPKEIKSNMFWIPSGALDNFCLAYGIYKDAKEKIEGDFTETNVRVKDLPVINRFYKPSDNTLYRYSVVREAREMVKVHNDRINNLKRQAAHFSDVYSQTRDLKADEAYAEALRLLREEMSDVTLVEMDKILSVYNKSSIRSLQQELGETYKDLKRYHPGAVKELDAAEKDLVQLMLEGVNQKKGLRRSDDVPEWIEWFDDHSPSRKERREE